MRKETSLNGGKTRPLTEHGYAALAEIAHKAQPRQSFNAGIADRLTRGALPLAEEFDGPNPFETTKKQRPTIRYLRLTAEGQRIHAEHVAAQARTNAKAGAR